MAFVRAERKLGHDSRLITLGVSRQERNEDICLRLPYLDSGWTRVAKRLFTPRKRRTVDNVARIPEKIPLKWKPANRGEMMLFRIREGLWTSRIEAALKEHRIFQYDVYQLDGGLGFYRDGRIIRRCKEQGGRVICCYTGSDLRTRGVIPEIDAVSECNVTVEFDHLQYHPRIHHVPFPLETASFMPKLQNQGRRIRIGHAPTNRAAKGSEQILRVFHRLEENFPIESVIIEGLPYSEAISRKRTCDVFVDQLGDLGYGMNGIEALAMGIPACSSLAPGFRNAYPDHPFLEVQAETLEAALIRLIEDTDFREKKGREGRRWVRRVHESVAVVRKIHRLANL